MESAFRALPSVDRVLSDERLRTSRNSFPQDVVVTLVRQELEAARRSIGSGEPCPSLDVIVESILSYLQALAEPSLCPVINATGVIIHTNLGRAPLSAEAIEAMKAVALGYSNLEFDLGGGERDSRHVHIERLLCQVTGAEAGFAVNNNAGAVMLGLTALAKRREVIVSRGQAVEIGGGFRIPDVMRQSGAKLVEVGTTNRTYIADYEQAITPRTAALLRVHSSNFKIVGFTQSVPLEEMAELAERRGLFLLDDLGSGCLLETSQFGLTHEPTVQESLKAGVSLAFFSGDKLLGGPQAGIIVGKKELVQKLKSHPLARALRMDKLCLAGLAATLRHYLKNEATAKIPVWRMIASTVEQIESRAQRWAQSLSGVAKVVSGESTVGGGSLPGSTLPSRLVAIGASGQTGVTELARRLRVQQPPVIGRIEKNLLLLDPRTVLPEEDEILLRVVGKVLQEL